MKVAGEVLAARHFTSCGFRTSEAILRNEVNDFHLLHAFTQKLLQAPPSRPWSCLGHQRVSWQIAKVFAMQFIDLKAQGQQRVIAMLRTA